MRNRNISNSTAACTIPAMGVRPPLLMLVIVRAMAPVAGIPPKIGDARLAIPWAISSVLESWRSPITPSATVAESSDSMAPSIAMVIAGETSPLITSHDSSGTWAPGSWLEIEKRSPMVSIELMPIYCFRSKAAIVITMMAISEPGNFRSTLLIRATFGQRAMTATEPIPTAALHQSIVGIAPK